MPSKTIFKDSWSRGLSGFAEALGEAQAGSDWPVQYVNSETGKVYQPHNDSEAFFVYQDSPRYMLLKGGEGGGKSTAGLVKAFNRLRRGMDGFLGSPDLEHFKTSIWPAFRAWCPWQCVIESQRYRSKPEWEASHRFAMVFKNELGGYSHLICGGFKEDIVESWEGGNVSFGMFDEARRHKTAVVLKMLDGRIRIPGPNNETPQLFFTTTPRKHWLFEYFAGARGDEKSFAIVPEDVKRRYADFKANAFVATILTQENEDAGNVETGFTQKRSQTLTAGEARVRLAAEWEDESDTEKFVNIFWWDACQEPLPPLGRSEPAILSLDAATGSETTSSLADCFAAVIVTRHPNRPGDVAVRYCGIWQAEPGHYLDFEPIEQEINRLTTDFSIIELSYDMTQLHDMAMRQRKRGINAKAFDQGKARLVADKQLQTMIMSRRIAHDGNPLLRQHIDNADIKVDSKDGVRIIKRAQSLKTDASVATSQGVSRCLYYSLG